MRPIEHRGYILLAMASGESAVVALCAYEARSSGAMGNCMALSCLLLVVGMCGRDKHTLHPKRVEERGDGEVIQSDGDGDGDPVNIRSVLD